jgi:uncharacterized protein
MEPTPLGLLGGEYPDLVGVITRGGDGYHALVSRGVRSVGEGSEPMPSSPAPAATSDRRVPTWALVAAGGGLVGYNAALKLVPFPAAAYVPTNLALAGAAAVLAGRAGLTPDDMGLGRRQGRGVLLGLGVAGAIAAGLLVGTRVPALAPLFTDERAAGLSGWALWYGAAIRIPLGTALPEELLFRGVLLGALRTRMSWWPAAAWSSVAFGLWHIGPTIVLAEVNALDGSPLVASAVVLGAVALTTIAGLGFCLLRRWGGGIAAPVLVHIATNSLSLLAAVVAQRTAS